jgi:putative restriction endonuclease
MGDIAYYSKAFRKIRRGSSKLGRAPHKPILLLSVIENVEAGLIECNKIHLTPELMETFKSNWSSLVTTNHLCRFALPFYHLRGDGFWHLYAKGSQHKLKTPSITMLAQCFYYAYLDKRLFEILRNPTHCHLLKEVLLETYFPTTKYCYTNNNKYGKQLDLLEQSILEESSVVYKEKFVHIDEEDQFRRGAMFQRTIPRIYDYVCSISRLRIDPKQGGQMIDACHIRQFSETRDDTISNGFSLSPTVHRAFDRGLIGIDDNYRIIISDALNENVENPFNLSQLEGNRILLPKEKNYLPSLANFEWHREHIFIR